MQRGLVRSAGPLLLLSASLLVALVIGEAGLRLVRPQVFPTIPAGLFTDRDDGFRSLTPGFTGTISRAEFRAPVNISTFGVRGSAPGSRTDRTFRVLSLGDSQTFGFGVLDHEAYPVQLHGLLAGRLQDRDVEVINAGVPGYGTVDELIWLREQGPDLQPDLISVQFLSVNDFKINRDSPLTSVALGDTLPVETVDSGYLLASESGAARAEGVAERPSPAVRLLASIHGAKRRSHLFTLISETGSYVGMRAGLLGGVAAMWGEDFTATDSAQTQRLMVLLAREAQSMDVPIVILYTTGKAQVIAGDGAPLRSRSVISAAAEEAGIPWIDMTTELRRRPDRHALYFVRDGHWTAAGHRAVAEVLAERLPELGLLPVAGR
jgi:lysophospholipase L1-like esterase